MPAGSSLPIEMAIGPSITFKAKIADLFFIPGNERIIINPAMEDQALFTKSDQLMEKLYKTLPYTPISAIGYNFLYELENEEDFKIPLCDLYQYNDVFKSFEAVAGPASTIQYSLAMDNDAYVLLSIVQKQETKKKVLSMNYHYQVNNESSKITHALKRFLFSYEHSKITSSNLIKGGKQ